MFCRPSQYWFYKHISCRPAPHLHLLANSLHPQLVPVLQSTYHVGMPQICIPLQVFCTPGWYWFYKHISCWPAPHLHPLANSLYPRLVWVLQTHLMSACPTFASPCWFFAPPAGTGSTIFCTPGQCGFYKHIPNWCQVQVYSSRGSSQVRTKADEGEGQRAGQGISPAGVETDWIQRQGCRALIPCVGSGQGDGVGDGGRDRQRLE